MINNYNLNSRIIKKRKWINIHVLENNVKVKKKCYFVATWFS